ncbi:MAG: hypothetical protein UR26_C0007G0021 [candidate division TM6 bacterium GW2011_GWF2_32_72]|nr:MAG: hypothetical protein UR26_C0007G0021 [candidate division TM6 bacterium GW2011_GWF2_32_72]
MRRLLKFSIAIVLMFSGSVVQAINWTGPIAADVVDTDINVTGDTTIVDGVSVMALTTNVNVNITGDYSISGTRELYFYADSGQIIYVNVDNNLSFFGGNDGVVDKDFLITVSGLGDVIFILANGKNVSITKDTEGSAQFYVLSNSDVSNLSFTRENGTSNSEVIIGSGAVLGYIAEDTLLAGATDQGRINFDVSNEDEGRTVLRIQDNGAVVVTPAKLNVASNTKFVLTDITQLIPGNGNAVLTVSNSEDEAPGLLVINENTVLTDFWANPWGTNPTVPFSGVRKGFVLGCNGILNIGNNSYFDYVGTVTNESPWPVGMPASWLDGQMQSSVVKNRNASALIVDGNYDYSNVTIPAKIMMENTSAFYLRSGVDKDGVVVETVNLGGDIVSSFTINPDKMSSNEGLLVMDVEGTCSVFKSAIVAFPSDGNEAIFKVLGMHEYDNGGPIMIDYFNGDRLFKYKSFLKDADENYYQYNKAYVLANARIEFENIEIIHVDTLHTVKQNNDVSSEPTYVGGETFNLKQNAKLITTAKQISSARPKITLLNSNVHFNESAAFTGVDLFIPNYLASAQTGLQYDNESRMIFYSNGRLVDSGSGRNVIMGTDVGSSSSDGTLVNRDAHLDIFQDWAERGVSHTIDLYLDKSYNTTFVNENIDTSVAINGQDSVETIYIGHASNVSIGTAYATGTDPLGVSFALTDTAVVTINGDYMSFETRGGSLGLPELSGTTGEGGIFVDRLGQFIIGNIRRANVSAMVTLSADGIATLPKSRVRFDNRVGITDWQPTLANADIVLNAVGESREAYTLDWEAVVKDYSGTPSFTPYPLDVYAPYAAPAVVAANLFPLPVFSGIIDQLQIKRARLGDEPHIKITGDKTFIRELIFLTGFDSAEAPVGVVVLDDNARLGLGSADRTVDSSEANVMLGVNGVTLIPNSEAVVELNDDILVNNMCHILRGTAFGINQEVDHLIFTSQSSKELRIKGTGTLDLTQFTNEYQRVRFAGNVKLVLEPGAELYLGGGMIEFTDNAQLVFSRFVDSERPAGTSVTDYDDIRVKLIGSGIFEFSEYAALFVEDDSFVGIESNIYSEGVTTFTWNFLDSSSFKIGDMARPGGALQIGNTTDDGSVSFELNINGIGAEFELNRLGFFGTGVGVVDKRSLIPNEWAFGALYGVDKVTINIPNGKFLHNQIINSADSRASLWALGPVTEYTWSNDSVNSIVRGGGNIALLDATKTNTHVIVDVVATDTIGLMSSSIMLADYNKDDYRPATNLVPADFFRFLRMDTYDTLGSKYCPISQTALGTFNIVYIDGTQIFRRPVYRVIGDGGNYTSPQRSQYIGALGFELGYETEDQLERDLTSVMQYINS